MRDEARHARRRRAASAPGGEASSRGQGPANPADLVPADPADLVTACRSARLSRPAYRFYRAILLTFASRGRAPDAAALARLAAEQAVPLEASLASLAAHDLAHRDPATGAVAAAYPFSGVPTPHRVTLLADASGRRTDEVETVVYAMCALDALGIPLMLGRAAVITSEDALTGGPVVVLLRPHPAGLSGVRPIPLDQWQATWQPAGTVLLARPAEHEAEHDAGACTAAGACCPITNFFGDWRHAADWQSLRPPPGDARVTPPAEALRRAHALFAGVLDRERQGRDREREEEGGGAMPPEIEVLYFAGCANYERALELLLDVVRAERLTLPIKLIAVETEDEARAFAFHGSPTIRIAGADVAPVPADSRPALACRVYRDAHGRPSPVPPREAIVSALRRASGDGELV